MGDMIRAVAKWQSQGPRVTDILNGLWVCSGFYTHTWSGTTHDEADALDQVNSVGPPKNGEK